VLSFGARIHGRTVLDGEIVAIRAHTKILGTTRIRDIPVPRWYWRLLFKWELMRRDPLMWNIAEDLLRPADAWNQDEWVRYISNCVELCKKYRTLIYVPEEVVSAFHAGVLPREEAKRWGIIPISFEKPIVSRTNWLSAQLMPYAVFVVETPTITFSIGGLSQPYPTSDPEPVKLKSEVDLEKITMWDLELLAREVKSAVREALRTMPTEMRSDPPELAFLRTVTAKKFDVHLLRYDLHIKYGLTFRLVAVLESLERRGRKIQEIPRHRRVGLPVKAESAVADSVKLIYKAIHRRSYNAKRRRLDHPAEGFEPYCCPHHPNTNPANSCDEKCKHLKDWKKRIWPTLPSEKTGK
jgi:hypothetical protein